MNKTFSEKIGFGGGCHWCTEAVFQTIKGVGRVEQGHISSYAPHTQFSEAVIVHFNPNIIELHALIRIHLDTHSSTSAHSMRNKYRSAIYTFTLSQEREVIDILKVMQKEFSDQIVTRVMPFRKFEPSADEFCDYYNKDPRKPFCRTYIAPKLKFLEDKYPDELKN